MILEPTIKVECDECGDSEEYSLVSLAGGGWDDRNLERVMEKDGWVSTDSNRHLCSICAEEPSQ